MPYTPRDEYADDLAALRDPIPPPKSGAGSGYLVLVIVVISCLAGVGTLGAILYGPPDSQLALISAITTFALSIITPILAILQRQNQMQVREIHYALNSRLSALVARTAGQAGAEGELAGRQYQVDTQQAMLDGLDERHLDDIHNPDVDYNPRPGRDRPPGAGPTKNT